MARRRGRAPLSQMRITPSRAHVLNALLAADAPVWTYTLAESSGVAVDMAAPFLRLLAQCQMVEVSAKREGRGRPRHYHQLTPEGRLFAESALQTEEA